MRRRTLTAPLILSLLHLCVPLNAGSAEMQPAPGTYHAVGGRVDRGTFDGWVVYHTACHICHGTGASGSDIAPDLRPALKNMTATEFTTKVLTRYRIFVAPTESASVEQRRQAVLDEVIRQQRGPHGSVAMPAWESNPEINPHILDLYAYLKARADNVIGPGQPKVIRTK